MQHEDVVGILTAENAREHEQIAASEAQNAEFAEAGAGTGGAALARESHSRRSGTSGAAQRHRAHAPLLKVLRRGETRVSAPALLRALDRLELARGVGVSNVELSHVPANRLKTLSAYAVTSKLSSLADDRRVATLLAFVRSAEASACDDALDILDHFMETVVCRATSCPRA